MLDFDGCNSQITNNNLQLEKMVYGYKNIWKIASPILVGMVIQQLIGVTDVVFLGRVGQTELGASAIAGLYYITVYMLGVGFGIGVQILIVRLNGSGHYKQIAPLFYQALGLMSGFAVAAVAVSYLLTPSVLPLLISSERVLAAAQQYLGFRVWGFVFSFAVIVFRAFYVGTVNTRVLTWSAVVMLAINVVGNYLLIFGKFGFPQMGIGGAALASVIAEAVSALFFVFYTRFRIDVRRYGLDCFSGYNPRLVRQIFSVSIWTTIQLFISFATWFFFFVAIEHLGEFELASSNVLRSISTMLYMVVGALGATASSLTANLIGKSQQKQIAPTLYRIIRLGFAIEALLCTALAFFPEAVMRIYTDDPHLIAGSVEAYYVMLGSYVTIVPAIIVFNVVIGSGRTRQAMYIELAATVIYVVNVWYVVVWLRSSLAWCWSTEYFYNLILLDISLRYLQKRRLIF